MKIIRQSSKPVGRDSYHHGVAIAIDSAGEFHAADGVGQLHWEAALSLPKTSGAWFPLTATQKQSLITLLNSGYIEYLPDSYKGIA